MDIENSTEGASKQQGNLLKNGYRKNTYIQNQQNTSEIPYTQNNERRLRKLNSHKA